MANISAFVNAMQSFEGTVEEPNGSNCQWLGAEYGMNCVPWCAIGVSCAAHRAGHPLHEAAVINIERLARSGWEGMSWVTEPEFGAIVCFDFGGRGLWGDMHTGVVTEVLGSGRFWTSECNISNVSKAVLRDRKFVRGFALLPADEQPAPEPAPTPIPAPQPPAPEGDEVRVPVIKLGAQGPVVGAMQQLLKFKGGNPQLDVDNDFGEDTDHWLRDFQSYYDVANSVQSDGRGDGICGNATWQALVDIPA